MYNPENDERVCKSLESIAESLQGLLIILNKQMAKTEESSLDKVANIEEQLNKGEQ